MTPSQLIAFLHALKLGDLEALTVKLGEAREVCLTLGRPELADCVDEAAGALRQGDVKTYRRKLETLVSRLGHLR
jgi:cobalamin biosynthesis protein CobD/CbiB